jgi:hypothetical protein
VGKRMGWGGVPEQDGAGFGVDGHLPRKCHGGPRTGGTLDPRLPDGEGRGDGDLPCVAPQQLHDAALPPVHHGLHPNECATG